MITPWLVCPRPNPRAALRLLCFPYAGGGAQIFRTWPAALPPDVELLAVELPGRGTRFSERPFEQLPPLIDALTDALGPALQAPFAIYGHSMGAVVGFSFARELRRRSLREPVHLFMSGRRAPQLPEPTPMHQLPAPQFLDRLRRLGGIPDALFQEPELMEVFLPILRADVAVAESGPVGFAATTGARFGSEPVAATTCFRNKRTLMLSVLRAVKNYIGASGNFVAIAQPIKRAGRAKRPAGPE